jgi:3-deoxy-D-manno-octulosonic acid kinase
MAELPESHGPVVVRHAWHGGLLAPLTRDLYWPPTRAPLELAQSMALRSAGIPTTEILGIARYAAAMGLVRVDVVSRYLEGTHDLGAVLAGQAGTMPPETALIATRQLLVLLAIHRVLHPDLNVKNILLRQGSAGAAEAWMIDIDVVRFPAAHSATEVLEQNLARLLRSMRKWRAQYAAALSDAQLDRFAHDVREALAAHVT